MKMKTSSKLQSASIIVIIFASLIADIVLNGHAILFLLGTLIAIGIASLSNLVKIHKVSILIAVIMAAFTGVDAFYHMQGLFLVLGGIPVMTTIVILEDLISKNK